MRTLYLSIIDCLAIIVTGTAMAASDVPSPKDWLRTPPESLFASKGVVIAEQDYYVVGLTHVYTSVSWLGASSVKELTSEDARFLTGSYYKAVAGKKAYLVRGLFANETGRHFLSLYGDSLIVSHGSLGHSFTPNFSPIVVHLDHAPKEVYVSISGAQ